MNQTRRPQSRRVHRRRRRRGRGSGCFVMVLFLFGVITITSAAVFLNTGRFPAMANLPILSDVFAESTVANDDEAMPVWGQTADEAEDSTAEIEDSDYENYEEDYGIEDNTDQIEENVEEGNTHTTVANTLSGQEAFSVFQFYIADNAQYYADFQAQNPHMDAETVVWKVNAFLHLPHYSHIIINYDANPLLVNPVYRLPYGFSPAVLLPVYEGNMGLLATPATVDAFQAMRMSAQNDGLDLAVVSAYRPATRQTYLFNRQGGVDGAVARPYHSEHQTGRALDLWGPSGLLDGDGGPPSPTGIWVRENAHNYGFIVRYTEENTHITGFINEPWHITYVSFEIAQYIVNNNLSSLEEFVARYPWWGLP